MWYIAFCAHVAPGVLVQVLHFRNKKERLKCKMDLGSQLKCVRVFPLIATLKHRILHMIVFKKKL